MKKKKKKKFENLKKKKKKKKKNPEIRHLPANHPYEWVDFSKFAEGVAKNVFKPSPNKCS